MIRHLIQSLLIVPLLVSCGPAIVSPTTSVQRTALPTNTASAQVPTPMPTDMLNPITSSSCPELKDETPMSEIAKGTVLLDHHSSSSETLFLLDLATAKEYKLPYQSKKSFVDYNGPKVSPDGTMMAYPEGLTDGENRTTMLWVINAHADVLAKIPFNQNLFNFRWLDNQRLVFYTPQTSKDGTVLVFNPFTRARMLVSNALPGLDTSYWSGLDWLVEYSPDLQRVAYFGGLKVIVRDVIKKQTLWEPLPPFLNEDKPVWSPDGNKIAVAQNGLLYIIDDNGLVKHPSLPEGVATPSWSPDGHYIAFWYSGRQMPDFRLMIYDIQSTKVTDLCIEEIHPDAAPLWSRNSQQIVVGASLGDEPILVDIQKNVAYKLKSTPAIVYPWGWMNSLP